jgi:hypothetical protein
MQLDECTPYETNGHKTTEAEARKSMEMSRRWALRSKTEFERLANPNALFGIVQGGMYEPLREASLAALVDLPEGYSAENARQLPFTFGVQDSGAPFCTVFKDHHEAVIVPRLALATVTATSPQTLSLVGLVPASATLVKLALKLESAESQTSVVVGPSSALYQNFLEIGPGLAVRTVEVPVSAGLTVDAFLSVNSGESSCEICLEGYCTA